MSISGMFKFSNRFFFVFFVNRMLSILVFCIFATLTGKLAVRWSVYNGEQDNNVEGGCLLRHYVQAKTEQYC